MAKGKGLGRGLDALFADNSVSGDKSKVTTLRLFDIEPNREQPRKHFAQEQLEELADSIKEHGLLQPLIVRPKSNGLYEIVAGERRWRASKLAGLSEIPVIIKDLDKREASETALVENLQRENLNPVEEANGYKTLMTEYSLTQEQVAQRVGKSRAAVANAVRILALPGSILEMVIKNELSYAHARTILSLDEKFNSAELERFAKMIVKKKLSVRETEKLVRSVLTAKQPPASGESAVKKSYYDQLGRRVGDKIGHKVLITEKAITIRFSDTDDLEELITGLCGKEFFKPEN